MAVISVFSHGRNVLIGSDAVRGNWMLVTPRGLRVEDPSNFLVFPDTIKLKTSVEIVGAQRIGRLTGVSCGGEVAWISECEEVIRLRASLKTLPRAVRFNSTLTRLGNCYVTSSPRPSLFLPRESIERTLGSRLHDCYAGF